jgi:hypothetical protein
MNTHAKGQTMMITIRNTNERFGDAVEFSGETIESAVAQLQDCVRSCGCDWAGTVITESDYEIVSMDRSITRIKIYWDVQDPANEGWAYEVSGDHGTIDSGAIEVDDLDEAIEEAIRMLDMPLTADQFAREPHVDGGYAVWSRDDS